MKTIGIIQCRMSSSRLPGKAIKTLSGTTVLEWVIKRVKRAKKLDTLLIATTDHSEDNIIEQTGNKSGIPVIRGARDNVLKRYVDAMKVFHSDAVVRITADNPLTDPETMDKLIDFFSEKDLDYSYTKDIPYGAGVDVFKCSKLLEMTGMVKEMRHKEHINTFFLDHPGSFKLGFMDLPEEFRRPDVFVTLDTQEDLDRLQNMFSMMSDPLTGGLQEIIKTYDSLPAGMKYINPIGGNYGIQKTV